MLKLSLQWPGKILSVSIMYFSRTIHPEKKFNHEKDNQFIAGIYFSLLG